MSSRFDNLRLDVGEQGDQAYLKVDPSGGKVARTVRLLDFVGYADGPDVNLDLSRDGRLIGIECLMFAPRATLASSVPRLGEFRLLRLGPAEVSILLPTAPSNPAQPKQVTDLHGVVPGLRQGELVIVRDSENILAEIRVRG